MTTSDGGSGKVASRSDGSPDPAPSSITNVCKQDEIQNR